MTHMKPSLWVRAARLVVILTSVPVAFEATSVMGQSRLLTPRARLDEGAVSFVLGNVEYLVLHELAHFLINEKDVPILGPEENAADYLATLALIGVEEPERREHGIRSLLAAADAFIASWQTGSAFGAEVPYWGAHALGIQRYYQIACLLYGSDPIAFADIPATVGLPRARATSCIAEYARAERAILWLLDTFGKRDGDPPGAGSTVSYGAPGTRVESRVLAELRSRELLEQILARLHARFTIEEPFSIAVRRCGQAEAAWIPAQREISICFELLDTLYLMALGN
jgi:Putative metallopeptidase